MSAEIIDQANELAELQREAAIAKCRINHAAISATHCRGLRGRDTRAAPGTYGGLSALR
ncbi:phage/conjugal plasmid C-4 type zinc finger protein, TraR family [Klebsiella pneumoniae]|uniref:Phage/conjugal plasmid C-4 type zinc finger protein, TraR family n=1 Tax=Klebsiella pneumoniae TaxID=573 RepID=A0A377V3I7_KLEPN|nr:phage/conjugal plasmid C-4 type zinc finger protein, TraR family [Klebsiella pneumoniae]